MSESKGARPRSQPGPPEQTAAGEAAPASTLPFPPQPGSAGPELARRLAEDAAAMAEAESSFVDDPTLLVGEEEREPALGFYLVLAAMVTAMLAIVIAISGSRPPVDTGAVQGALRAHLAPAGSSDRSPRLLAPPDHLPARRIEPSSPTPAGTLLTPAPPSGTTAPTPQPGAAISPVPAYGTGRIDQRPSPGPRTPNREEEPALSNGAAAPTGASPADTGARRLPDPSLQLHVPPLLLPANPSAAEPAAPPSRPGRRRLALPDAALMREPSPFGL